MTKSMNAMAAIGILGVASLGTSTAGAESETPRGDTEVISGRAAAADMASLDGADLRTSHGDVRPTASAGLAPTESALVAPAAQASDELVQPLVDGPGEANYHSAEGSAELSSLGTVRAVIPNDYARNDSPGILTTTVRVYGRDWLQTDSGTPATLQHRSELTCTGTSVGGISVGTGGVTVSGGVTSKTASIEFQSNDWVHYFDYYDGAEWRCSVSNLTPAKSTRRAGGLVSFGNASTSPRAEYSFIW